MLKIWSISAKYWVQEPENFAVDKAKSMKRS